MKIISSNRRIYGIDVLRLVAMFFVMTLHILGHGGILDNVVFLSANYYVGWGIEILAFCAVDIFIIISGYVGLSSKNRYSNIIVLWIESVLYSLGAYSVFAIILKQFNIVQFVKSGLIITGSRYWFLTAYIGMSLFSPFINYIVNNFNEKKTKVYLFIMMLVFSLLSVINGNVFEVNAGNSTIWFILLYMVGAVIRKNLIEKRYKINWLIVSICAVFGITWGTKIGLEAITYNVMGSPRFGNMLIKYSSPTIVIMAILMVLIFANINVHSLFRNCLDKITPLIFSAYLIQDNYYVREHLIQNRFIFLSEKNVLVMFVSVLGISFLCMAISMFVDILRVKMFNVLSIKQNLNHLEEKFITKNLQ